MEISDVLSSIRRLVSEDRRALPVQPPVVSADVVQPDSAPEAQAPADSGAQVEESVESAAPAVAAPSFFSRMPAENRFVLTAALRVGERTVAAHAADEGNRQASVADPESAAAEPTRDLSQEWDEDRAADEAKEEADDSDGGLFAADEAEDPDTGPELFETSPLNAAAASKVASLEATIAELEAAVAGIQAEFEPDHGDAHEVETDAGDTETWPTSEAASRPMNEFRGIMAGFDAMAQGEERLDMSVTGEAVMPASRTTMPPERGAERSEAASKPMFASFSRPVQQAQPEDAQDAHLTEQPDAPDLGDAEMFSGASEDTGVVSVESEDEAEAGETGEGGADLGETGDNADFDDEDDYADRQQAFEAAAESLPVTDEAPEELAARVDEPMAEPEVEMAAGIADEVMLVDREPSRPTIIRPDLGAHDEDMAEAQKTEVSGQPAPDLSGQAGSEAMDEDDAGVAADSRADDADDALSGPEEDLFDPLAGSDLDIDMLRDMVAEIIRDELRSTLGERITRNLRTLVRREIDRALVAEGLKRG